MPAASALKVLIVDDQQSMRQLLRYCLDQMGIRQITECKDGRDAAASLQTQKFDLIISDWNMEDVDGLTLLKAVRSHALTKKTPFIMATGQKSKEQVLEAVNAGVNNYVTKPFNVNDLKKKVEAVLGKLT